MPGNYKSPQDTPQVLWERYQATVGEILEDARMRAESLRKVTDELECPPATTEINIRALAKRIARLERLAHEHKTISELIKENDGNDNKS